MRTLTKKPQREQQMKEFQELKTRPIEPNDEKSIKILEHPNNISKHQTIHTSIRYEHGFLFSLFLVFDFRSSN